MTGARAPGGERIMTEPSLRETAERLNAHLKRIERAQLLVGLQQAGAYYMGGARIRLTYVSRAGGTTLTRSKALAYLAWLDSGGIGRHDARVTPNVHATTARLDGHR